MQNYPSTEQLAELMRLLTQARIANWQGEDVGTWRWWVLLALFIVPWFVWFKLADRKNLLEMALFGAIVTIFSITLDELGLVMSLWHYQVDLIPVFPRLTSVDYTVLPVTLMLIYQYFPTGRSYFRALVILSAFFAFAVEPVIIKLGFYIPLKWSYPCSFLAYIFMGLMVRWLVKLIVAIQNKHDGD